MTGGAVVVVVVPRGRRRSGRNRREVETESWRRKRRPKRQDHEKDSTEEMSCRETVDCCGERGGEREGRWDENRRGQLNEANYSKLKRP